MRQATGPVAMTARVLVYRSGSLGDTIVALPCFHQIRRSFANATIRVMTDVPYTSRALAMEAILGGSGLVNEFASHPNGLRDPRQLIGIIRDVRTWRPDVVVHLPAFPSFKKVVRDVAFFRLCGVPHIAGAAWSADLRTHRFDPANRLYESEASRLARCLSDLGTIDLSDPANWRLNQTEQEHQQAGAVLNDWDGRGNFIAFSPGTKVPANKWGDQNWRSTLKTIGNQHPQLGLAVFGGPEDRAGADAVLAGWPGPRLNLCGDVTPRVSALLLRAATLYVGHDSGPMHLAASAGTRCVCVFSRHNLPGWWFPVGTGHIALYPWLADGMLRQEDAGISEISVAQVTDAVNTVLASHATAPARTTA